MSKVRRTGERQRQKGDKRWFGAAILFAGLFIMLRKFDLFYFNFHTMWPWILILVGAFVGAKSKFRNNAWWILVGIGTVNLIEPFTVFGVSSSSLIMPAGLIILGLAIIFGRDRKKKKWDSKCKTETFTNDKEDMNINVSFGGHKELVTSKDFKGGRISATFGGVEVNLMNAVSQQNNVELNMSAAFAAIEIIIPSHWELVNEMSTTAGSIEDHRTIYTGGSTEEKTTLVLTGSCTFGSVEIKSY